ncbi:MAG: hypothetical protein ACLFQO_14480 [Cyclobacteriaceae bacterium]
MDKHHCPICSKELKVIRRYPKYVCPECKYKATDKDGHELSFSNVDFTGGFTASYTDTGEKYNSHTCYIDGIECYADEARFGGVVIQTVS